jgi:hypothetical protein
LFEPAQTAARFGERCLARRNGSGGRGIPFRDVGARGGQFSECRKSHEPEACRGFEKASAITNII